MSLKPTTPRKGSQTKRTGRFRGLFALEPEPLVIEARTEDELKSEFARWHNKGWASDWTQGELPMPASNGPMPCVVMGYRDRSTGYLLLWIGYRNSRGAFTSWHYEILDRYQRSRKWDEESQIRNQLGYPNTRMWREMSLHTEIVAGDRLG